MRGKEGSADYQDRLAKVSFCIAIEIFYLLPSVALLKKIQVPPSSSICYFYAAPLNLTVICVCLCFFMIFLLLGSSGHQGAHDETRHYDGGLPTFGEQGQLFPRGCFLSAGYPERYGLLS